MGECGNEGMWKWENVEMRECGNGGNGKIRECGNGGMRGCGNELVVGKEIILIIIISP